MPSILLVRVDGGAALDSKTVTGTNSNLTITLEGCVTQAVVSACNTAIEALANAELSLKSGLPLLRLQGGRWQFVTSCDLLFHSTIMAECFVAPINRLNYHLENPCWEADSKKIRPENTIVGYSLTTPHTRVFVTDEDTEAYYPGIGSLVGGDGTSVQIDPERSLDLAPDTVFSLAGRDLLVLGVGWSPLRNKTYEMLMSDSKPPDIDLVVYLANRWGEPLFKLSTKGRQSLETPARVAEQLRSNHFRSYASAVKLSRDSADGSSAGDDERAAIFLPGLDMSVCSILVTVSIAANARDFDSVRNVYVRLLDVETKTAEVELCRFQLPDIGSAPEHKTAVLLRIERADASANLTQPLNPSDWELRTVGGFCLSNDPAMPDVQPGDIVSGLRYGDTEVSLNQTSEWSLGSIVQGGQFDFNIDRIEDVGQHCAPVAMKFTRLVENDKTYEVVFDDSPTAHMQFSPQQLRASKLSLIGLSTHAGMPMVDQLKPSFHPRLVQGQLTPYLGCWAKTPRPDRIMIHDVRAYIPAADRGGTSDAYCVVFHNKLETSATKAQFMEAVPKIVKKSEVLKKTPCPALVSFGKFSLELPIDSMNGAVPKCMIKVCDKDFNILGFMRGLGDHAAAIASSTDDCLLQHKVNLSEFACRDATKTHDFVVVPDFVGEIMDQRSNAGFTKEMVTLLYKVTVLLPGETFEEPKGAKTQAATHLGTIQSFIR